MRFRRCHKDADTFTTDLGVGFDYRAGQLFFSVARRQDKPDEPGATYDFIIGSPDQQTDPDYYRRLAELEKQFQKKHPIKRYIETETGPPSVVIRFPFNPRVVLEKNGFKALIETVNIAPGSIVGYSVYIDDERREVPGRVSPRARH